MKRHNDLKQDPLARVQLLALLERFGPEEVIAIAQDQKKKLPPLPQRKFEQLKIDVDFKLPMLLRSGERLDDPRFDTIVAAFAKVCPDLGDSTHRTLAKRYQRYRRQEGAKKGISVSFPLYVG